MGINCVARLQNTERLDFRIISGKETDFFFRQTLIVIYDSMQLGELIPNITSVLRKNVSVFAKLPIPGRILIFLETSSATSIQWYDSAL